MTCDAFRHQCEEEKAVLAQQVVDLEMGLAEQARLLAEARQAAGLLEDRILRLEISLANLSHWIRQQHKETTYDRLLGALRRLAGRGL